METPAPVQARGRLFAGVLDVLEIRADASRVFVVN
jgi:hypothetical protein